MRISDWNSDVCSSDLPGLFLRYLLLIQYRIDSQSHLVHVGHAINSAYNATRFIDRQDRRRFGSIFRHAGTNRFLIIVGAPLELRTRSEEHTSELQSLMRNSYAVFCLKKKKTKSQQLEGYVGRKKSNIVDQE